PQDIEYALEHHTELLDISQYDLQSIILEAQQHANHRLSLDAKCADIMTKDVIYLDEDDGILDALERFKQMNLMSLPVSNAQHQLKGTLALSDVVDWFQKNSDLRSLWQDQVKHIMHRQVVMVKPEQNIVDLIPYFVEKSFNYLPVVDDGKLIGIISQHHTELLDISQYDLQSIILEAQQHANHRLSLDAKCADIMTKDVIYLDEDDGILDALERFKQMNLMSLPVSNAQHQLKGTLALSDVVDWFQKNSDLRSLWQDQVKHIMHRQVVMVKPEQNIVDLIPYFVEKSFNYLPVVDDGKLIGIISRSDMIAVLYQNLLQQKS
ncbi:hypothetical protein GWI33_010825, partial [Rhynchophorus ferrugineus]